MLRRIQAAAVAVVLAGCDSGGAKSADPVVQAAIAPTENRVLQSGRAEIPDAGGPVALSVESVEEPALALRHECGEGVDHLKRARQLAASGDERGALLEARRAVFDAPAQVERIELAIKLARRLGEGGLARLGYQALSKVNAADSAPLLKMARLALQQSDPEGAIAAASEAIRRNGGVAEAFNLRGRAEIQLKRLSVAIVDLERAVELDGGNGFTLNNLGYAYLLAGKPQQAAETLEEAVRLQPHVAYIHNNLGVAYRQLGRAEDSREQLTRALELRPGYVNAAVNKGKLARLATNAAPAPAPVQEAPALEPAEVRVPAPETVLANPTVESPPPAEESQGAGEASEQQQ